MEEQTASSAQFKKAPEQRPEPDPSIRIPNLVVVDKMSGELLAWDRQPPVEVFHGQWSSLASGEVDGRPLVFWGDGYGIVHAFALPAGPGSDGSPSDLEEVWRLDGVPHHYRYDEQGNERLYPPTMPDDLSLRGLGAAHFISTPVFHEGRLYVALGRDRNYADKSNGRADGPGAITCIDPAGSGDITTSNVIWQNQDVGRFHATPSIKDGRLFIAGTDGILYCLDIADGSILGTRDLGNSVCDRSQILADGKIYVSNDRSAFQIYGASPELPLLFEDTKTFRRGDPTTPLTVGDVLYIGNKAGVFAYRGGGG